MTSVTYVAGDPVTIADLRVGDSVFARRDRETKAPKQPVRISHLHASPISSRRLVVVVNLHGGGTPWLLGWLEPGRVLTRAVPEAG